MKVKGQHRDHTGMCFAAFDGCCCVPTPSAPIFWLILVMSSVSFQYRSIAAAPQFLMSSNTAASSGSSMSASSFFLQTMGAVKFSKRPRVGRPPDSKRSNSVARAAWRAAVYDVLDMGSMLGATVDCTRH